MHCYVTSGVSDELVMTLTAWAPSVIYEYNSLEKKLRLLQKLFVILTVDTALL